MFNGTGASCIAAKAAGRNFIGIDLSPEYCVTAEQRLKLERIDPYAFMLERPRVRKAQSSRQLAMLEESGTTGALREPRAEYIVIEE